MSTGADAEASPAGGQAERLRAGIAAQEALRPALGDDAVDAVLETLRARLAALEAEADAGPAVAPPGWRDDGDRRHVTVLFADLAGYTALGERLDPEEVNAFSNDVLAAFAEVVLAHGGYVEKFAGDAVTALFGAPVAHGNDAERAVRAALAMRERLAELSGRWQGRLGAPLTLHAGVHTGPVVVGEVGLEERRQYTAMGDTINTAARLQTAARRGQVLVGERTEALTRHAVRYGPRLRLRMKGKRGTVAAFEALGLRDAPAARWGAGATPLVGRARELAVLASALAEARAGRGRVVALVGEAGIGKSRLAAELRLRADGFVVATGAATSYAAPPPFQIAGDLLRDLVGASPGEPEPSLRARLAAWLGGAGLDPGAHGPALGVLLGLSTGSALAPIDAAVAALQSAASRAPLLLVIEDLQWVDAASRDVLDRLVRAAPSLSLLICMTHRPDFAPGGWTELPWYDRLEVGPLGSDEVDALAGGVLGLAPPPSLRAALAEKCDGNPFFAEELLKALLDHGAIARTAAGYALVRDIAEIDLPDTIEGVVLARIDRLEKEARQTLRHAAVIGRRFPEELLKAVVPGPPRVERDLRLLEAHQLVHRDSLVPELEYLFQHFLTHDVAYRSLLARRRRAIHHEIARQIERLYRDRLPGHYAVLAHHFAAAEEWQQAAAYYRLAGAAAEQSQASAASGPLYEEGARAEEKLFERQTSKRRVRWALAAIFGAVLAIEFVIQMAVRWFPGVAGVLLFGCITMPMILMTRIGATVTVYADRLAFWDGRRITEVPFGAIEYVVSPRRRKLAIERSDRLWRLLVGRPQRFTGRVDLRRPWRFFTDAGIFLFLRRRDGRLVVFRSADAADVHDQLKDAVARWAAAGGGTVARFTPSRSPLTGLGLLPVRRAGGAPVGMVDYDDLLARLERGDLRPADEALLQGSDQAGGWTTLDELARRDPHVEAALHPLLYRVLGFAVPLLPLLPMVVIPWVLVDRSPPAGAIVFLGWNLLFGAWFAGPRLAFRAVRRFSVRRPYLLALIGVVCAQLLIVLVLLGLLHMVATRLR